MLEKISDLLDVVKGQEEISVAKANELINALKAAEFLKKKEEEQKKNNTVAIVIGIVLGIVAICAIAYGLYLYFTPDYLDDFEDEFDDDDFDPDFEDEFFEPDVEDIEDKKED